MNEYPSQWVGLPPPHTPTNKGWLLWMTESMSYIPKVHKVIVNANPYSFSCSSSKSALYSYLQPQLLHLSRDDKGDDLWC